MNTKTIILLAFVSFTLFANAMPIELRYTSRYIDPSSLGLKRKRTPPLPIIVDQNNRTFTFPLSCVETKIEIISDEMVVFSTQIDENGCVELPESLEGEFELRLYVGENVFSGWIEL